jgi:hypothetical protein
MATGQNHLPDIENFHLITNWRKNTQEKNEGITRQRENVPTRGDSPVAQHVPSREHPALVAIAVSIRVAITKYHGVLRRRTPKSIS